MAQRGNLLIGPCAVALVGCQDAGDRYDEQSEMLKETSAELHGQCDLARKAAEWAFANRERDDFRKWSGIKDEVCVQREGFSLEEVYGTDQGE